MQKNTITQQYFINIKEVSQVRRSFNFVQQISN